MMKPIVVKPLPPKYPLHEVDEEVDCTCRCRHYLSVLLVAFLYVFAVHVFVNALVVAIHYESFAVMFEKIGWVVRAIVAAVTTHRGLKEEPPQEENELLKKTKIRVFEEPQRVFVKSVVMSWCVTITFWLLKTAIMAWFFATRQIQDYFSHYFYAINIEKSGLSKGGAAAIAVLDWTINNCNSLIGGLHLTELIWKCYNMQKSLEQLEEHVYHYGVKLRSVRSQDLKETHLMYLKVRHNFWETEERFSFPMFLWILEIVIGIICCICGVHAVMEQNDSITVAGETVEIIYYLINFGIMSYEVSEIHIRYQFFVMTVGEVAAYVKFDDVKLCNQFYLLQSTVKSSELALTAWKFFPLDRAQSLSILLVVVAYAVILLQLSNGMQEPGESGHH